MKYYLDTEFHEYEKHVFLGNSFRTIEPISVGLVSEDHSCDSCLEGDMHLKDDEPGLICDKTKIPRDGATYYAVCKEFDLMSAWNSSQMEINKHYPQGPEYWEVFWLRENVLKPIFDEFILKEKGRSYKMEQAHAPGFKVDMKFTYRNFKKLLKKYGKSRYQIAKEVLQFVGGNANEVSPGVKTGWSCDTKPEFYAYFCGYDWVLFCWLYGKMIDLPNGYPMYCRDLKQISDEVYDKKKVEYKGSGFLNSMKDHPDCPRQGSGKHNALSDAKWNKRFHKFLEAVKNQEK